MQKTKNVMKGLTAKEEEIMGFFWEKGPLFVKEMLAFYEEPKPHFNTLSTIVRGLEDKGFLSHHTYGNTYQYYAVVSTPSDFRFLAPIVLEQALRKSGTQLLEPYLSFTLFAPQEYLSRAYNDAPKYCAEIETTQQKNDEVIFTGKIPARYIGEYRSDLNFYTNGRSVCLTELKGYQESLGEPVIQVRRPNSRLDKVRHMFNKTT